MNEIKRMSTKSFAALLLVGCAAACAPAADEPDKGGFTYAADGANSGSNQSPSTDGSVRFTLMPVVSGEAAVPTGATLSLLAQPELCMDLPGGNMVADAPISLYTCNGGPTSQAWSFVRGQVRTATNAQACLDVRGGQAEAGAPLVLQACNTSFARQTQLWRYDGKLLQISGTTLCARVDGNPASGVALVTARCDAGDARQRFGLAHKDATTTAGAVLVIGTDLDKCLDIDHGKTDEGTAVFVFACHRMPWQQWVFEDGMIRSMNRCLQTGSDGVTSEMGKCTGAPRQKWAYERGQLQQGGKCLVLPGNDFGPGVRPALTACGSQPEQQWFWGL